MIYATFAGMISKKAADLSRLLRFFFTQIYVTIIKNLHDSQKEIVTFSSALPNCK